MQVGAAFTVLQSAGTEGGVPLELQAAKSRLLHLEPAAGAAGLTQLLARLQQTPSHETLHLRSVNSHVATIFQVGRAGGMILGVSQEGPLDARSNATVMSASQRTALMAHCLSDLPSGP